MWRDHAHFQGSEGRLWRDKLVTVVLSSYYHQNYLDKEVLNQSQEFSERNGLIWMLESYRQRYCSKTLGYGLSFLPPEKLSLLTMSLA